jgi:hypothetical protein
MARERWFFASSHKRQGPMPLAQLVEGLLRLPDPRSSLVWKFGLPAWTPARDVDEIDRHLAPFVAARKSAPKAVDRDAEAALAQQREDEAERLRPRPTARAKSAAGPSSLAYASAGGGVIVLGLLVWLFWPKAPPPRPKSAGGTSPGLITLKEGDPTGTGAPGSGSATGGGTGPAPGQAGFAGWSNEETRLPNVELARLKGVAGWSDKTLEVTVYNGSAWRITELLVKPHRLVKEAFVEDERPLTLLPVGVQVEQGVDQLMNRVAPDRRRAGVNPLDTGKFVALAGNRPEAFRAPIVGAKGYPPK